MGDALDPVDLGSGAVVVAISAGSDHTCALLDDRSLKVCESAEGGCFAL